MISHRLPRLFKMPWILGPEEAVEAFLDCNEKIMEGPKALLECWESKLRSAQVEAGEYSE